MARSSYLQKLKDYKPNWVAFSFVSVFLFALNMVALITARSISWGLILTLLLALSVIWMFVFDATFPKKEKFTPAFSYGILIGIFVGILLFFVLGWFFLTGIE